MVTRIKGSNIEDGAITAADIDLTSVDTDDISEGANNVYFTTIRANTAIDNRVTKSFVDGLGVNASTLGGNESSFFTTYTDNAIAALANSAPATLDTLNELAAALNDDANFSTTVTNSLAGKLTASNNLSDLADAATARTNLGLGSSDSPDFAGLNVNGTVTADGLTTTADITFGDNDKAIFGAGSDLQIYHDGFNSYIVDNGAGGLFQKANAEWAVQSQGTDEYFIRAASNAWTKLYYNGSEKLATTATGVDVTGNVSLTGTVDGRDVAADGTKLDGIESGATADQTASEILTAIKTVDGSGSGLDADLLDGVQGSSYLRSDTSDTFTGTLTVSGNIAVTGTVDGRDIAQNIPSSLGTAGQVLTVNAGATAAEWAAAGGGGMKSMQVFTSSGTWTKPAGISLIRVRVQGAGGGATGGGLNIASGAAGGYTEKVIDVSAVSTVSVTVGSGGSGVTTGTAGTGGTSSFGSYCTAAGGEGANSSASGYRGPRGGTSSGGDLNVTGGDGFGSSGNWPTGGASFFGQGGRGSYGSASSTQPSAGRAYGSGGGAHRPNTVSYAGGAGAPGVVIVEEYE